MNILTELILSFLATYGGVFLIYYIAMAGCIFSGFGTEFLDEHFMVFMWCALLAWMIALSVLLAVRRYKKIKKVYQPSDSNDSTDKNIPHFWVGKKLLFSMIGLLISPFLWLLINWTSSQEGIIFEFLYMALMMPVLLLPPVAAWLELFKD